MTTQDPTHYRANLKRLGAGHYQTGDGLYEVLRNRESRFPGWIVTVAPTAKASTPLSSLAHEQFETKAEAVATLEEFRNYLAAAAKAIASEANR